MESWQRSQWKLWFLRDTAFLGPHSGFCDQCGTTVVYQVWGLEEDPDVKWERARTFQNPPGLCVTLHQTIKTFREEYVLAHSVFPVLHKFLLWSTLLICVQETVSANQTDTVQTTTATYQLCGSCWGVYLTFLILSFLIGIST